MDTRAFIFVVIFVSLWHIGVAAPIPPREASVQYDGCWNNCRWLFKVGLFLNAVAALLAAVQAILRGVIWLADLDFAGEGKDGGIKPQKKPRCVPVPVCPHRFQSRRPRLVTSANLFEELTLQQIAKKKAENGATKLETQPTITPSTG